MPELPDVEYMKQYVDATALHQEIKAVEVSEARLLDGVSASKLRKTLRGRSFAGTARHGKHLFLDTGGAGLLRLHFGMTGFLNYFKKTDRQPDFVRVLLSFTNDCHLAYSCQRLLGQISLEASVAAFIDDNDLGPDALAVDLDAFKAAAGQSRQAVKSFLMDQAKLAGVGNVYSDEILFQARLHPRTTVRDLRDKDLAALHRTMRRVLRYAIRKKADPSQFSRRYLLPRRSEGAACPRCGQAIESIRIAGRTGRLCPACQPENRSGAVK